MKIGDKHPVKIQGAINLSPESFYKGSIKTKEEQILRTVDQFITEGVDIIDVGAMSTAPYLETQISPEEETKRVVKGLELFIDKINKPVSVDTTRSETARAAIEAGGSIINDVSGLTDDPQIANVAAEFNVPIIIGASKINRFSGDPTRMVISALKSSIDLAVERGVNLDKIIIDPDIGFHRKTKYQWYEIDAHVLTHLRKLKEKLKQPICVGVSRKSFIGHILNIEDPGERLFGSLGATAVAIQHGANLIRTHDVRATVETIRIIEKVRDLGQAVD
ncbi:MAG: dihydropteroate synthase [Candidatus Heimdallarchaeota archaeon]|nr:dihydropteroate synthase [Candidatus Heimdallarchaeota archaeon]